MTHRDQWAVRRRLRFPHFDAFEAHLDGMDLETEILQLSAGPFDYWMEVVDLPELRVLWNYTGGRYRFRDVCCGPAIEIGVVLEARDALRYGGTELGSRDALVWLRGEEQDYIASPGTYGLVVRVEGELADSLGWEIHPPARRRVPEDRLHRLIETCRQLRQAVRDTPMAGGQLEDAPTLAYLWRDRVLAHLEPVLEPWLTLAEPVQGSLRGRRHTDLVRRAESWFLEHDSDPHETMGTVARELGISRRSLYHGFRRALGVGPRRYFELLRLHELYRRLASAGPGGASVTELAGALGFTHLGRLSVKYRELFGERPNETLARG